MYGIIISLVILVCQLVAMVAYTQRNTVSLATAKWQQESAALSIFFGECPGLGSTLHQELIFSDDMK